MLQTLSDNLREKTKKTVKIKINDNKSHYFVLKDHQNLISISLHRHFLEAPLSVLDSLVTYIISKKKEDFLPIKQFIYSIQKILDFSDLVDQEDMTYKGEYFDLLEEYNFVNEHYFNGSLELKITWFKPVYKTFRHITFGSYDRQYKLIRVNKLLDHKNVIDQYIKYLIFHEMLHEVYPSEMLKSGRYQMHGKAFKEHEKKFPNFTQMKKFEKYFMKNIWRKNGRA